MAKTKKNVDIPLKNLKHELFCKYFVNNSFKGFNNATWSYALAYDYKLDELDRDDAKYEIKRNVEDDKDYRVMVTPSSYSRAENVCASEGSRLLRNPKIQERITKLFNLMMTDEEVDKELMKVIKQDGILAPKIAAIKEFNALKGRVVNKNALTDASGKDITPDDESINKSLDAINKLLNGNSGNTKKG